MNTNKKRQLSEKDKKLIGVFAAVFLLLFFGVLSYIIGKPMIAFVSEPQKFRLWVEDGGIWSRVLFILMVFFQVVLALIPGEPLEIGAGYAFGAVEGTILTAVGTVLGSITVFFLVKRWGIRLCEVFFPREKLIKLKFLKSKKSREILSFIIFFLPGTPKDLVTYFLGLTDVNFTYVLFLSGVARLPSIITSTLGGDALGGKKYAVALIVFGITAVVSGAGFYVYNKITAKRKTKKENLDVRNQKSR